MLLIQDVVSAAQTTLERFGALGLVMVMVVGGGWAAWKVGMRLVDAIGLLGKDLRENTKATQDVSKATERMHRDLVDSIGEQIAETRNMKLTMEQLARLRGQ